MVLWFGYNIYIGYLMLVLASRVKTIVDNYRSQEHEEEDK